MSIVRSNGFKEVERELFIEGNYHTLRATPDNGELSVVFIECGDGYISLDRESTLALRDALNSLLGER